MNLSQCSTEELYLLKHSSSSIYGIMPVCYNKDCMRTCIRKTQCRLYKSEMFHQDVISEIQRRTKKIRL